MILSFDEIKDWQAFEDLAAAYFRSVQRDKNNDIIQVDVEPSGEGPDGGCDIFVSFEVSDSIRNFKRKWVVQCKFYSQSVSKRHLASVNIPSLVHEYGADGYLLICKQGVTAGTRAMFKNLNSNCKFKYTYEIWEGRQFLNMLQTRVDILTAYFPEFFQYCKNYGLI